jgi:hypothetical protein
MAYKLYRSLFVMALMFVSRNCSTGAEQVSKARSLEGSEDFRLLHKGVLSRAGLCDAKRCYAMLCNAMQCYAWLYCSPFPRHGKFYFNAIFAL